MFTAKGKIIYDPRSDKSAFLPWTCILKLDGESIGEFYRYWVKKNLGVQLNRTIWKDHITVVRGTEPRFPLAWKKHAGRVLEFTYTPMIYNGPTYYWIQVECPELCKIRRELGLPPYPRVPFHLTVGNVKNVNQEAVKPLKLPAKVFPFERPEYFNRNY